MNSLQDIVHALKHPAPRSPLAPLTESHTEALHQLVELLTNVNNQAPAIAEPRSPPLRVAIAQTADDEPTIAAPNLIEDGYAEDAARLRVAEPPVHSNNSNSAPQVIANDSPNPAPKTTTKPQWPEAIQKPTTDQGKQPTIPTTEKELITYGNSTGPTGRRRRKQKNKKPRPAGTRPIGPHPEPVTAATKLKVTITKSSPQAKQTTAPATTAPKDTEPAAPIRRSRRSQNRNSTKATTTTDDLPDLIAPGDDDSSDEESDTEPTAKPLATAKRYNTRG
jgi:hypothetical protein